MAATTTVGSTRTWIHNQEIGLQEPAVSLGSASLQFADGLFETLRVQQGRAAHVSEHLARITASAASLGWPEVSGLPLASELQLRLEQLGPVDGALKLLLVRAPGAGQVHIAWVWTPRPVGPVEAPLRVRTDSIGAVHQRPTAGHKTTQYNDPMILRERARAQGFDDTILLDPEGSVLESTVANLFLWDGTHWKTPPLSLGVLPGIVRAKVLEHLRSTPIPVIVTALSVHDVYRAEQLVLTNSLMGVAPVASVDGQPIGKIQSGLFAQGKQPGAETRELIQAYEQQCQHELS